MTGFHHGSYEAPSFPTVQVSTAALALRFFQSVAHVNAGYEGPGSHRVKGATLRDINPA